MFGYKLKQDFELTFNFTPCVEGLEATPLVYAPEIDRYKTVLILSYETGSPNWVYKHPQRELKVLNNYPSFLIEGVSDIGNLQNLLIKELPVLRKVVTKLLNKGILYFDGENEYTTYLFNNNIVRYLVYGMESNRSNLIRLNHAGAFWGMWFWDMLCKLSLIAYYDKLKIRKIHVTIPLILGNVLLPFSPTTFLSVLTFKPILIAEY